MDQRIENENMKKKRFLREQVAMQRAARDPKFEKENKQVLSNLVKEANDPNKNRTKMKKMREKVKKDIL